MADLSTTKLTSKEYKQVYDAYYISLCLFADNYLDRMEMSKDIVQEVFINIWKKEIAFKSKLAIKSYLYTAVKNRCIDYLKSKEYKIKTKISDHELSILSSDDYFEKEVFLEEVSRLVHNAVNTLPNRCKEIMKLSLKGLGNTQISEELSLSISTIKAQKRIAYQKLRPLLKENIILFTFISCFF